MDLIKIKLKDLNAFYESEFFESLSVKPITSLRVESFLANPRADLEDIVLYIYVDGSNLLSFVTVLADYIFCQGKTIKFGWPSATWVNPDYRGNKLSGKLMETAFHDWNERLMITNYTEVSEKVYLKTQLYYCLEERKGQRFYLYPDFKDICKDRKKYASVQFILPVLTWGTHFSSMLKSFFSSSSVKNKYIELDRPDDECWQFLAKQKTTLFNRKEKELKWIFDCHWVTGSQHSHFDYPFSYAGIDYSLKVVKIFDQTEFVGFFVYSLVNSKMKILFHYLNLEKVCDTGKIIFKIAKKKRIAYLTVLDFQLIIFLKKVKYFAFSKTISSHVYSTFPVERDNDGKIFDGDGDNCFT